VKRWRDKGMSRLWLCADTKLVVCRQQEAKRRSTGEERSWTAMRLSFSCRYSSELQAVRILAVRGILCEHLSMFGPSMFDLISFC